jgi:hypothetical protein
MPILVACPTCGHRRQADEREACMGIKCPKCFQSFLDVVATGPGQKQDNGGRGAAQTSLRKRMGCALSLLMVGAGAACGLARLY